MKQRIFTLVIALSLLATMPAWGQTTVIKRNPTFLPLSAKAKAGASWNITNDFSEGLAVVMSKGNGKFGFVDRTGKLVIPCKLDNVCDFSEGLLCLAFLWHLWRCFYLSKVLLFPMIYMIMILIL